MSLWWLVRRVVDRTIVRQAYETAIESVARLSMYAFGMSVRHIEYEVAEQCRKIALEDIVVGALAMRRLMDASGLVVFCQHAWLPAAKIEADHYSERVVRTDLMSAWQVFGAVVHARRLELIDEKFSLAMHSGKRALDIALSRGGDSDVPIAPFCYVKSDHRELRFFMADFAGCCQSLIETARKVASKNGLHLDGYFDDI